MSTLETEETAPRRGKTRLHFMLALTCLPMLVGQLGCDADPPPAGTSTESAAGRESAAAPQATGDSSALAEALRLSDPLERVARVAELLRASDPDRLETLKATFEEAGLDRGDLEYVLFITWWAEFSPAAAYAYTFTELRYEYPRTTLAAVRTWARSDPQGALQSGAVLDMNSPTNMYRGEMLDAVIVGWFESGQPGLEEFLSGLDNNQDTTNGMRAYARMRVLRDGARETLEWTRQPSGFPAANHRLLIAGALSLIAHQEPELAAEWLSVAEQDGVDVRTFVPRIAGAWAHHDPVRTAEWLRSLPADSERERALRRVGERWIRSDPDGLLTWLAEHRGEGWLDVLRLMSIRSKVHSDEYRTDWAAVIERSNQIVSEATRTKQLIWSVQRWRFVEPEVAEAWIAAHREQFSESQVAQMHEISRGERTKLERALGLDSSRS